MKALRILAVGIVISLAILLLRWSQSRALTDAPTPPTDAVTARAPDEDIARPSSELPQNLPPVELGALVPDAALTDQDGNRFRLSDLRGKVVVLSFIYTSCDMPSFCPMTASKLLKAQSIAQERELADVEFLAVSFDVERDNPKKLKEFASLYEADFSSFRLATGEAGAIAALSHALNTYYREMPSGQFEHNSVTSVLDREGKLRDQLVGPLWTIDEVIASVERIVGS